MRCPTSRARSAGLSARRHRRHAEPLLVNDVSCGSRCAASALADRFRARPPKSMVFAPLDRWRRAVRRASRSRTSTATHAFSEADVRLLTTLASSLSVALENARLVDETRQRAAELATVNEVGQATASQLDLDSYRAGRRPDARRRSTPTSPTSRSTTRDRPDRVPVPHRERREIRSDATSRSARADLADHRSRASRCCSTRRRHSRRSSKRGRAQRAQSYLGVPIMRRRRRDRRHQRPEHARRGTLRRGRRRLLTTLAANIGAAIQNARLYGESQRRATEMAALAEVGPRDLGDARLTTVLQRIVERAHAPARRPTRAPCSCPRPTATTFRAIARYRRHRRTGQADARSRSGRASSARSPPRHGPRSINDVERRSARRPRSPARRRHDVGAPDGRAADRSRAASTA